MVTWHGTGQVGLGGHELTRSPHSQKLVCVASCKLGGSGLVLLSFCSHRARLSARIHHCTLKDDVSILGLLLPSRSC